jgi:hypothetical protein
MLDLFLFHPKTSGLIYNIQTEIARNCLTFKATELRWNAANQENDETDLAPMDCKTFAVWYDALIACGWKIQTN